MSLDPALRDLMWQTVTLSTFGGMSAYGGTLTYGTAKTYAARVEREIKMVKDAHGREVPVTTTVYVGTTTTGGSVPTGFNPMGKIVLPTNESPTIVMVNQNPDESGVHHTVVYCG